MTWASGSEHTDIILLPARCLPRGVAMSCKPPTPHITNFPLVYGSACPRWPIDDSGDFTAGDAGQTLKKLSYQHSPHQLLPINHMDPALFSGIDI